MPGLENERASQRTINLSSPFKNYTASRNSAHHNPPSFARSISHKSFKMGDVMVESSANQVATHRKQMPSSIPNIDSLEGLGTDGSDEYSTLKKLQRHLE